MAFRDYHPGSDMDAGLDTEVLCGRCISLIPIMIGLLAAMNIASVVFVLME